MLWLCTLIYSYRLKFYVVSSDFIIHYVNVLKSFTGIIIYLHPVLSILMLSALAKDKVCLSYIAEVFLIILHGIVHAVTESPP